MAETSVDGRTDLGTGVHTEPALRITTTLSRSDLLGLLLLPVALYVLWQLWLIAALALLAGIVAVGAAPAVAWLERRGLPRAPATLILYGAGMLVLGGLGYVIGQIVIAQTQSLATAFPQLTNRLTALDTAGLPGRLTAAPGWLTGLTLQAAGYAGLAVQALVAGLFILLLAFYLLVDGPRLWQRGLRLVPEQDRLLVDVLSREVAEKLRGYLQGVALSGLAVGVLTGLGLVLLGVPYAVLFGVLAGLLEAVPYLGPLLAAVGPFTFALGQSLTHALVVAAFFVAVQQIEEKVLVPRLQSHTTGLHPLTVILATLIFGALFGVLGVVLAVPLAAAVQAIIVCLSGCLTHPDGAGGWVADCRPELAAQYEPAASSPDTHAVKDTA